MENPRTSTARDHDDSALIDAIEEAPDASLTSGGNLARDVASRNELAQLDEPEALTRPQKDDDIGNDQARQARRTPD